jgi:biopolymer transport protein ExbD
MQQMAQENEDLSEVNVIPLADLSLVLLIILMVISPLASLGMIQIMNGKASAAVFQEELDKPEPPVIVSFEPGKLRINNIVMGSELEFVKRMSAIMQRRKEKSATLTVESSITHGKAVRVMNLMKRQGVNDLVMLKWDPAQSQLADEPAAKEAVVEAPKPKRSAPRTSGRRRR